MHINTQTAALVITNKNYFYLILLNQYLKSKAWSTSLFVFLKSKKLFLEGTQLWLISYNYVHKKLL